MAKIEIKEGDKKNKLTAISYSHIHTYHYKRKRGNKVYDEVCNHIVWNFRCDCGNEKKIQIRHFFHENSKSCGCEQKRKAGIHIAKVAKRRLGTGNYEMQAFNKLYAQYRSGAAERNYCFNIDLDNFRRLTKLKCGYCGDPPSNTCNEQSRQGKYVYNGLDRINNNLGYELDNVISCCKQCNRAKNVLGVEEFKFWIRKLINNKDNILNERN